jgi:hypothetical protein
MDIKTILEGQSSEAALQSAERPLITYQSPLQPTEPSHEQQTSSTYPKTALILCEYDTKTGSRGEADKRKANNAASRRFRDGKKKLQSALTENERLSKLCDHYHSERNFYRDELHRYVPQDQLPPRPSSPHQNTYAGWEKCAEAGRSLEWLPHCLTSELCCGLVRDRAMVIKPGAPGYTEHVEVD